MGTQLLRGKKTFFPLGTQLGAHLVYICMYISLKFHYLKNIMTYRWTFDMIKKKILEFEKKWKCFFLKW
jgi:hypothetical protein